MGATADYRLCEEKLRNTYGAVALMYSPSEAVDSIADAADKLAQSEHMPFDAALKILTRER